MAKRLLLVDDDPAVRRLLAAVLEDVGFEVDLAANGAEALERIREQAADLCVLDVMMPRMDGWEVLRCIREDELTADVPVVMLTARGEPSARLRGWQLGCDGYVSKPFEPSLLVQEVLAAIARDPADRTALRDRQLTAARAQTAGRNGHSHGAH